MNEAKERGSFWRQVAIAVLIALLAGGSAPWWWNKLFGPHGRASNGSRPEPAKMAGTYFMDNSPNRIIVLTSLGRDNYRMEEPSSPWPWEGTARLDGGRLSGEGGFRNSQARMRVEGVVRGDGSIVVAYKFLTDDRGQPTNRVDNHVWFPQKR